MAHDQRQTATYFAFRDDVLTRLIARQAEMQYAYEDRIAELRARVDRTTSRQLLDQEQYDQKLNQIMRRQAQLESRAAALNALPDAAPTGSIKPAARGQQSTEVIAPAGTARPSPINDTVVFVTPPDRDPAQIRAPSPPNPEPNSQRQMVSIAFWQTCKPRSIRSRQTDGDPSSVEGSYESACDGCAV